MDSNQPPPTNHKPPPSTVATPQPHLPGFTYFRDHHLPAGHMVPAYSGTPQVGGPTYRWGNDYHGHPIGTHEEIWRQIEKERIREEIITGVIARRYILEAEVRRELLIERDLAIQRESDGSIYASYLKSMIDDPKGFQHLTSPYKLASSSQGERTGMSALVRHEFGSYETESQRVAEPRTLEYITPSDTVKEKQQIIFLAKPEEKNTGMKRKAEVLLPVGVSELTSAGDALKKKVEDEWNCALCPVSTTSQRALDEHLRGKKHKAKEALLGKNGKNISVGLFPKTIPMPNEIHAFPSSPCSDKGVNFAESMKPRIAILRNRQLDQTLKNNEAPTPACITDSRRRAREQDLCWCEICQVGVTSESVMERHRNGKKHRACLLKQNTILKPSTQIQQAKQEMNLTEESGEVVDGTASRDSAPIMDEVKLNGYQRENIIYSF